jgi:hypothetical protein
MVCAGSELMKGVVAITGMLILCAMTLAGLFR